MASLTPRTKLLGLSGLVLIAAILAVGIAAITKLGIRQDGPLVPTSATALEFPLAADQPATWGISLPANPTGGDIRFTSIEPIDPAGLSILGVTMSQPNAGGIVNAYGYPPPGMAVVPVEGARLPAGGEIQVLVGVQLAAGSKGGSIMGLLVEYVAGGQSYEVTLPYKLQIVAPTK
jgi:hypothetical protein